jgi:hypothetical protein
MTSDPVRLAIRGFVGQTLVFEEHVSARDSDLGGVLPKLAEEHAANMAAHVLHMIEIEFLDEANENERFFRFGTDPSGMVWPIAIPPTPEKKKE